MARPKDDLDLPDGWKDRILTMYAEGASDVEVKAWIYQQRGSYSNDLWERWINEEPEFSETIKVGKTVSEAWWERSGRKNLNNKDFSYTGWYMNMKNRFGWKDKQEIQQSTTIKDQRIDATKLTDDELRVLAEIQRKSGASEA